MTGGIEKQVSWYDAGYGRVRVRDLREMQKGCMCVKKSGGEIAKCPCGKKKKSRSTC